MNEDGKTPVNSYELRTIEFMMALNARLRSGEKDMRDRLRTIPNGWRQYRMVEGVTDKLLDRVYNTMPTKTIHYIEKLQLFGEVKVQFKPASQLPGGEYVKEDDLKVITNCAMAASCAVCLKDEREIKRCKLRKALQDVLVPEEIPKTGCPYRDVAADSEWGDYV